VRRQLIKRYFITGLLIWVPLAITAWVLVLIVGTMDQSLRLLPEAIHPRKCFGFRHSGCRSDPDVADHRFDRRCLRPTFIGQRLVVWWERLLARIPVVNSIYNSVKQVSDTLFSSSGNAFRKALLIEYPRRGAWTIAFLTGRPGGDVLRHLDGEYVSVYVPTTPNPTSGFFLMLPKVDVIELEMSVDTALKYVISMGVVATAVAATGYESLTTGQRYSYQLTQVTWKQHADSLLRTNRCAAHRPGGDALWLGTSASRPRWSDLR
jgi:uncharacterized membrane protein